MKLGATVFSAVVFFLLMVAAKSQDSGSCYPGIACPGASTQAAVGDQVVGPIIADFSFNQNFVIDGVQNLVWSRNLYAIGDTTALFKEASAGNQTLRDAFSSVKASAQAAAIGDLTGWRLAKRPEVDALLSTLDPTTIYIYFRARAVQIPYRWVFGAFDGGDAVQSVPVDGSNYSNTSLGRLPEGQQPGSPNLNPYGFWLVKEMTPEVERAIRPTAEPLRQYREPVEERRLNPVSTYSVLKAADSFAFDEPHQYSGTVSTTSTVNSRYYVRYNLKQLPKGVLVGAEVLMSPLSWSGSPTPTVKIDVMTGSNQLPVPADLWAFAAGEAIGVWQPPNRARLELPEQIARNAYNVGDDLFLSFSTDFNSCQFATPELIVRFVQEPNVLFGRQLP
ncbi:hypothetical protein [Rhizobium leguminosarum]|uniref:hypothetical protein n=1 Tax=Rhizobium leguminosarum TaxID=384 RepID=UPI001C955B99|nr:hypothetical protein [Rhizobium leguminosarum]MBY5794990.1 hypothetical protein [Rhizobium leguminosarum]